MSERMQHDEQCSSLHAEGLIRFWTRKANCEIWMVYIIFIKTE